MIARLGLRGSPERALESLYERHAADVYRYALVMLDSAADAEDVTQTTFLNAYRALLRGDRPREPRAWLRAITHNLCLQQFRRAARRPHEVALEEEETPGGIDEEPATKTEDLVRALRQIPQNQRAALVMRELEGRSIAEIGRVLELTPSAVEALLFRARRSVREQLEGHLTCERAEQAISRQLDGTLPRAEASMLRAHLRQCEECARLARSLRAQRGAIKSLAVVPLPLALAWSRFGTGAAVRSINLANAASTTSSGGFLAGSAAGKVAAAVVVAALATGVAYKAVSGGHQRANGSDVSGAGAVHSHARISGPRAGTHRSTVARPTGHRAGGRGLQRTQPIARNQGPAGPTSVTRRARVGPKPVRLAASGSTSTPSTSLGTAAGTGRSIQPVPKTHPTHLAHPVHPVRAVHLAHPVHPVHPAHPVHPVRNVAPTHPVHPAHQSTSTGVTTSPQPTGSTHPAHPTHQSTSTGVTTSPVPTDSTLAATTTTPHPQKPNAAVQAAR